MPNSDEELHVGQILASSQKKVNLIWEYTQSVIAIIVVVASMATGIFTAFGKGKGDAPTIISVAFGTVVGFYFGRTNHTNIGGVKSNYDGR